MKYFRWENGTGKRIWAIRYWNSKYNETVSHNEYRRNIYRHSNVEKKIELAFDCIAPHVKGRSIWCPWQRGLYVPWKVFQRKDDFLWLKTPLVFLYTSIAMHFKAHSKFSSIASWWKIILGWFENSRIFFWKSGGKLALCRLKRSNLLPYM